MKSRSILIVGAVLLAGATVFAHHIQVGLSSVFGTEILSEVVFHTASVKFGVAPHVLGTGDHTVKLSAGHSSFAITDTNGNTQTIDIDGSAFANPAVVDLHEVVEQIEAQLTVAEVTITGNTLVFRGKDGGSTSTLTLADGPGAPLAALEVVPGLTSGADNIELSLSIPLPEENEDAPGEILDLAHHPYVVVLSTTEGSTGVGGFQIPVAFDAVTELGIRATNLGLLPGFFGQLDANSDALVTFDSDLLAKLFPAGLPAKLHFAYVVLDPAFSKIEFASNRFDVVIED